MRWSPIASRNSAAIAALRVGTRAKAWSGGPVAVRNRGSTLAGLHIIHPLVLIAVGAVAGTQLGGCARGDIVLGTAADMPVTPEEPAAQVAGRAGGMDAGGAGSAGQTASDGRDAAAGSGSAAGPQGGAGGTAPQGGAAGLAADAGPPTTVTRPSPGCGKEPALAELIVRMGSVSADYLVDLPAGYDSAQAYPLVITFRGSGVTTNQFRASLSLSSVVGDGAIVVHANCPNGAASWEAQRDIPLFDVLLAKLKTDYCIDEDRSFALGDGSGALLVNLLGCVRADDLRAFALLSGAPPPGPGPCDGAIPVMLLQQMAISPTLGLGLGNRDFWIAANGCDIRAPMPAGTSGCVDYGGCNPGFPVRYCGYDPSGFPSSAATSVWSFFQML